jgi:hypothetical protein
MNPLRVIPSVILLVVVAAISASAQQDVKLKQNAALRYWSAFAQMQDSAITDEQVTTLGLVLDGSSAYDDAQYKDLVEKNRPALETMARATTLPTCDWGVDYQLGSEAPVDYVRKALILGRLNVLYALHLAHSGDKDAAVRALALGLHFSNDVSNGGSLFATLAAKSLIAAHLKALASIRQAGAFSDEQRSALEKAVVQLQNKGLNWPSAMKREFDIPLGLKRQDSAAIEPLYLRTLDNPSMLPELQQMIANAPRSAQDVIPNPKRVLEERQELRDELLQTRSLLR